MLIVNNYFKINKPKMARETRDRQERHKKETKDDIREFIFQIMSSLTIWTTISNKQIRKDIVRDGFGKDKSYIKVSTYHFGIFWIFIL